MKESNLRWYDHVGCRLANVLVRILSELICVERVKNRGKFRTQVEAITRNVIA